MHLNDVYGSTYAHQPLGVCGCEFMYAELPEGPEWLCLAGLSEVAEKEKRADGWPTLKCDPRITDR